MPRSTSSPASSKRRKRVLQKTKGYFGNRSRLYRYAKNAEERAGQYAYRDRRKKKSTWRQLWIVRINAACRQHGINYSRFMSGLRSLDVQLDRKQLSELAINDEAAFAQLVDRVKSAA